MALVPVAKTSESAVAEAVAGDDDDIDISFAALQSQLELDEALIAWKGQFHASGVTRQGSLSSIFDLKTAHGASSLHGLA